MPGRSHALTPLQLEAQKISFSPDDFAIEVAEEQEALVVAE